MAELVILGSGTGLPHKKRWPSGYLLRAEGRNILIDSGWGTLHRLIRVGITYQDIDHILYSHLHPDHVHDFTSMLFAARNPRDPRRKDLAVIGPNGLEDFYNKLLALYGTPITPESYKVVFNELGDNELDLNFCKIRTLPVVHTKESIAFRIELKSGATLTYSGDTEYCENIVSLSKDADLLILECSFPDEFGVKGHLTPSSAGRIASEAGSKRLVLTHLYPVCDRYPMLKQCRRHFKGSIVLARDYAKFRL